MEFFVSLVFREQNNSPIHWKKWQPPRHSQTSIFSTWTLPSMKVSRLFSSWREAGPAAAGWGCVTQCMEQTRQGNPCVSDMMTLSIEKRESMRCCLAGWESMPPPQFSIVLEPLNQQDQWVAGWGELELEVPTLKDSASNSCQISNALFTCVLEIDVTEAKSEATPPAVACSLPRISLDLKLRRSS